MTELITRINRDLRVNFPEEWPDVELTMPQFRTLVMLSRGPHRMSDIASASGSSLSATTAMIDRLIEKQLVIREHDTVDRRVVICRISELGQSTLEALWQLQQDQVVATARLLTDEELDAVNKALSILEQAAQQLVDQTSD